ncbi:mitochondrial K+-H+ exchange-related-domain-containing protein [Pseudoneurospora amorphoporcata]|uniref:Mitochondrial K+-H+ exchange-related-domain-containing protein n=1 Tax=Pseudoneurospora amorphoporcata TaxID=241081 RepID=A0AAN6NZM6_9PEZI|nr:mitochondrial K+-H+ exchange-related-domain-containing protein [Pseudoneurospora amorphoporcata]
MRLYLLPISTRRTLLYCQKLQPPSASAASSITAGSSSTTTTKQKQSWGDYIQTKAALTWASWEKKESGWQKSVVGYGNHLLRKLPYEEWALKSVPPLTKARQRQLEALVQEQAQEQGGFKMESEEAEKGGKRGKVDIGKVEVVYPAGLITEERVPRILHKLATEREGHHKKWFWYCLVGMPVTLPIGILPLVPNLPFFYLCYRAWSHHRALSGGKHLVYLLQQPSRLLSFYPSPILDEVYSTQRFPLPFTPEPTTGPEAETFKHPDPVKVVKAINATEKTGGVNLGHALEEGEVENGEVMLLSQENAKKMVKLLDVPELEVELERAIWQVETAVEKKNKEIGAGVRVNAPTVDDTKKEKAQ